MRSSEAAVRCHVAIGAGAGLSGSPLAASRLARWPLNELADIAADVMAAVGRAREDGPQIAARTSAERSRRPSAGAGVQLA
jgi:hypothetical protein